MPPEEIARHAAVLQESQDAEALVSSAIALADAGDRNAVLALGRALHTPGFVVRLEGGDAGSVTNLTDVFIALRKHPSDATGRLCELIYGEASFHELPARLNPLLHTLGAVKPVTPRAVEIFSETSAAGFAQVNGPVLLANGEPPALEVFANIITGDWVEDYVKVDILHRALLPVRDRLPVVQMCIRLWSGGLDEKVRAGMVETLFDYRSRDWFGPAMYPPLPPEWSAAPDASLELLLRLGQRLLGEGLPAGLQLAVEKTLATITAILQERRQ